MKTSQTPFGVALLGLVLVLLPLQGRAQSYTAGSVSGGGSITGSVLYTGEAPERSAIVVNTDEEVCGQASKFSAELIVDPTNHGIQNVVVSITDISSGKHWSVPDQGWTLDQRDCWFDPHVIVVPAGEEFNVLNNDGILHNLHTHSEENRPTNRAQPGFLKTLKLSIRRAEFVQVTCDVHSWMDAWIVVADHPYYAVTAEDGSFRIENVPQGSYTLEFWHEKLGRQSQSIEVVSEGAARIDVTFSLGG